MARTRTMSTYHDSVWEAEVKLFAETGKHWRPAGTFMDVTAFEETDLTLEELRAEAEAEGRKWAQWLPEGPPTHSWARSVDPMPNVGVDSADPQTEPPHVPTGSNRE